MNVYERVYELYLRKQGMLYFRVDQGFRWSAFGRVLKNFDYLVLPAPGRQIVTEVKGRRMSRRGRFETWVGRDDLESLSSYQWWFGGSAIAAICFVFSVSCSEQLRFFAPENLVVYRNRIYAPMMISLADFIAGCRKRSKSWNTFDLSSADFRAVAYPPCEFTGRFADFQIQKRAALDLGVFQEDLLGVSFEETCEHFLPLEAIEI
ncbi:MAG: HYExAFE family protein [Planctomycetes bacterium]|nr:HYExAFE family protein [Planctomycetota bacterium]